MREIEKKEHQVIESDKKEAVENITIVSPDSKNQSEASELFDSLATVAERYENEPPMEFLFMGIPKRASLTLLVGIVKSGKTSIAENLSFHLLNNSPTFLGLELNSSGIDKILYLNFEEFLQTNATNLATLGRRYIEDEGFNASILDSLKVRKENSLKVRSNADFTKLIADAKADNIKLLIIDSLSKLYDGDIERSNDSKKLFEHLNRVRDELGVPIILIHHTTKIKSNEGITLQNIAGSRILQQEADAIIVVNKIGIQRYIKPLVYRYKKECDSVTHFKIEGFYKKVVFEGKTSGELFEKSNDGRSATAKYQITLQYIKDNPGKTKSDIVTEVVDTCNIARSTVYDHFKKIESEIKIIDNKYYSIEYKEPSEPEVTVQTTTTTVKINKCKYGCIDNIDDKDI